MSVQEYFNRKSATKHPCAQASIGALLLIVASGALAQTLPQALDTPGWAWTAGGSGTYSPWAYGTSTTHDGIDSAGSRLDSCYDTSSISTTVTGPGKVSFWNRVDNQYYYFPVYLASAGNMYLSIDGQINWLGSSHGVWYRSTNTIPAGQHTLSWGFLRADYYAPPTAYLSSWAWLDEVAFVADAPTQPSIITTNGRFGFTNGVFRFTITGPAGSNAVVAASGDLHSWVPITTNSLGTGTFDFTDSLATNYSARFYRVLLAP